MLKLKSLETIILEKMTEKYLLLCTFVLFSLKDEIVEQSFEITLNEFQQMKFMLDELVKTNGSLDKVGDFSQEEQDLFNRIIDSELVPVLDLTPTHLIKYKLCKEVLL